jgi:4-carboxymuconolactone decarboxylase
VTRLQGLPPSSLTPAQLAVYTSIASGPRAAGSAFPLVDAEGALVGPFNAMLLQPALGDALQALGAAVRYATSLTGRAREIAILVVARVQDSGFERYAHEAAGSRAGLSPAELAALASGDISIFADPVERSVAETVTALASRGDLTDEEFAAARDGLGTALLFELTTLVGYYGTLALQLRVFRVPAPLDSA